MSRWGSRKFHLLSFCPDRRMSTLNFQYRLSILVNENVNMPKILTRTKKTSPVLDVSHRSYERRPVRVYLPGEEIPQPGKRVRFKPTIAEEEKSIIGIKSDNSGGSFVDKTDDLFGKLMGDLINNPNRKKIALEGTRIIEEALKAGLRPEKFFLLKSIKNVPAQIKSVVDDGSVELIRVSQKQMETWTSVTTPPGIIGVFPKPKLEDILKSVRGANNPEIKQFPLTLICDNLREPGNLGSILRSAAGVGCKMILLSKGCTDPWDGKVLRGGCGAHFQIPILTDIHMSNMGNYIDCNSGYEISINKSSSNANANEDEDEKIGSGKVFKSIGVFLADSNKEAADARSTLPIFSYTEVNYRQFDEIYLVVGGETEGLSKTTLQITNNLNVEEERKAGIKRRIFSRLHIPLQSSVESLNVANAFGIIAFEIRRQVQKNQN